MKRRTLIAGAIASAVLSAIPFPALATTMTAEDVLVSLIKRFPVLTGMRIVYADHPGLGLWPGKVNGVRDYRTIELWDGYSYSLYPDALLHEVGHALNYWSEVARREPARLIQTTQGPVAWDSVLDDFWKTRGLSASPFSDYVSEEAYRRELQSSGVQQFAGSNYYYQFTPSEQFANCFAAVMRGLRDESQLGNFHTTNWGIPLDFRVMESFFSSVSHPRIPRPPTDEFRTEDYAGMSVDGSLTVWYSETRKRDVFFVNGAEVL